MNKIQKSKYLLKYLISLLFILIKNSFIDVYQSFFDQNSKLIAHQNKIN